MGKEWLQLHIRLDSDNEQVNRMIPKWKQLVRMTGSQEKAFLILLKVMERKSADRSKLSS
ncbi:MAG TPA: hypothetical protein PLZ43_07305 [bacterium]|nr:hypothetical protein [bacterium]